MKPSEKYELVICGIKTISQESKKNHDMEIIPREYEELNYQDILEMLADQTFNSSCAKRFKKSIIDTFKISFPENLDFSEDVAFTAAYVHHINNVKVLNEYPYLYMKRDGSLSSYGDNICERLEKSALYVESILLKRFPELSDSPQWKHWVWNAYYFSICYFREKKTLKEQYVGLKDIFGRARFRALLKEPEICMPKDSQKFIWAISRKSPMWVILLFKISEMKNRLNGKKNKE